MTEWVLLEEHSMPTPGRALLNHFFYGIAFFFQNLCFSKQVFRKQQVLEPLWSSPEPLWSSPKPVPANADDRLRFEVRKRLSLYQLPGDIPRMGLGTRQTRILARKFSDFQNSSFLKIMDSVLEAYYAVFKIRKVLEFLKSMP